MYNTMKISKMMLSFSTISIYKYVAHDRDPQKAKKRKRLSSFTFFSFSSKMKRSIKPYLCRFIENSYPVSFFTQRKCLTFIILKRFKNLFFQTFFDNLFIKWYTNNTVIFLYWYKTFPIKLS